MHGGGTVPIKVDPALQKRVRRLLRQGYPLRQIERITGLAKHTVGRMALAARTRAAVIDEVLSLLASRDMITDERPRGHIAGCDCPACEQWRLWHEIDTRRQ